MHGPCTHGRPRGGAGRRRSPRGDRLGRAVRARRAARGTGRPHDRRARRVGAAGFRARSHNFIPLPEQDKPILFSLLKNGEQVQVGDSKDMLFSFDTLIAYVSQYFTLHTGDLLFTGTPAGVGPVAIGDQLQGLIADQPLFDIQIK